MTRLFNDPASFTQQTISGFVAAHPRWVQSVPAGSRAAPILRPAR